MLAITLLIFLGLSTFVGLGIALGKTAFAYTNADVYATLGTSPRKVSRDDGQARLGSIKCKKVEGEKPSGTHEGTCFELSPAAKRFNANRPTYWEEMQTWK